MDTASFCHALIKCICVITTLLVGMFVGAVTAHYRRYGRVVRRITRAAKVAVSMNALLILIAFTYFGGLEKNFPTQLILYALIGTSIGVIMIEYRDDI